MDGMFEGVALSTANYNALLQGWSQLALQNAVSFDAGNSQYSSGSGAATARQYIIDTFGWTISDGGEYDDDIDPEWGEVPVNHTLDEGQAFSYQVSASDNVAIDSYWLNDTSTFSISLTGMITSTTNLEIGFYYLEVFVNDTSGNEISAAISIEVQDASTDDEPTDDEPTDDEPTDDEPTDDEPTDDEPTDDEPTDDGGNNAGIPGYSLVVILGGCVILTTLFTSKISRKMKN